MTNKNNSVDYEKLVKEGTLRATAFDTRLNASDFALLDKGATKDSVLFSDFITELLKSNAKYKLSKTVYSYGYPLAKETTYKQATPQKVINTIIMDMYSFLDNVTYIDDYMENKQPISIFQYTYKTTLTFSLATDTQKIVLQYEIIKQK